MSSIRASWEFLLVLPEALWCGSSSCSDSRTAGSLRGTDADGTANVAAEQPIRPGMGRTISADAEALMRAPFALGDAGELSRLLERAGFYDCAIRAETGSVRFASAAMLVRSYIGGSPLAAIVATAPTPAYEKLVSEVERTLDPLIEQGSLCFPIEAH